MRLAPKVLENDVVRLEPFDEGHREHLRAIGADPTNWTYFADAGAGDGFDSYFDRQLAACNAGTRVPHVVVLTDGGGVAGATAFQMIDAPNATVEIGGTWYAQEHRGGRVNPACKLLLLERAFSAGANRVELKTDARNARSRAAIEKLGATFEGVHRRRHVLHDGFVRDTVFYSILPEEWPEVRAKLEARLARA